MTNKNSTLILLASALFALSACNSEKGWSVKGTVEGSDGDKIALQAFNNNNWYTIDSLATSANGSFSYQSPTPALFPEVLRLSLNGANIYFPVDSISKITVNAHAASFSNNYTLSGSLDAMYFQTVDSLIRATVREKGEAQAATDSLLKRNLSQIVIASDSPIAAYYIINKRIGNKAVLDPSSKRDLAIIGAAAQCFDTNLPSDPRTETLRKLFLNAKVAANPENYQVNTIEAQETGLAADIKAYDNKGAEHSLYDEAAKGNVLLLSFTNYQLDSSPAYNVILANLYEKYKNRGLEIFQLAFDGDEAQWKQSAKNLPWITVWNSPIDGSAALVSYNVGALPLTYVIDRKGTLRARVIDPTELEKEIAKHI